MNYQKLSTKALVTIVALSFNACVHSGHKSDILVGEADVGPAKDGKIVAVGNPPFTTLSLGTGGELHFVDAGDDYVGIVERIPSKASSVLLPLIVKWKATPLEIYLAFNAPGEAPHKALLADHKLQLMRAGNADRPPRRLQPPLSGAAAPPPVVEPTSCGDGSFFGTWAQDWFNTFEGVTDHVRAEFEHVKMSWNIYPGYHVYHKVGSNRITYLGACNGDTSGMTAMGAEVDRWSATNQSWVPIQGTDLTVQEEEKYLFYSHNAFGQYRARFHAIGGEGFIHHLGTGGAWTKSLQF